MMVAWNHKPKRKNITDVVDPRILERAKMGNKAYNEHLAALRKMGHTNQADVSLETSTAMVETASIIAGVEELENGKA